MELINSLDTASENWTALDYEGANLFEAYLDMQTDLQNALNGLDNQESYLGYVPSADKFIAGFDVWFDEEEDCPECYGEEFEDPEDSCGNCCDGRVETEESENYTGNAVMFSIVNGEATDITVLSTSGRFIYSDGVLRSLHSEYKDLVDIRLD